MAFMKHMPTGWMVLIGFPSVSCCANAFCQYSFSYNYSDTSFSLFSLFTSFPSCLLGFAHFKLGEQFCK